MIFTFEKGLRNRLVVRDSYFGLRVDALIDAFNGRKGLQKPDEGVENGQLY
jgi:hypothetical protein